MAVNANTAPVISHRRIRMLAPSGEMQGQEL
jgi:hypothetical protein